MQRLGKRQGRKEKGKGKTENGEKKKCIDHYDMIWWVVVGCVCFPEVSRACSLYVKTRTILPKYVKMFIKYVNCRSRHNLENFT